LTFDIRRAGGKLAPINHPHLKKSSAMQKSSQSPDKENKGDLPAPAPFETKNKKIGFAHRKNITNGLISLPVKGEDRVAENTTLEFRENILEALDVKPKAMTSYMESTHIHAIQA
jgi:hypothetical protein